MDTNQLFSIIEENDSYTEETISEVKKLLGNFPYFQTGHMLLLKALSVSNPIKFNEQLNISGSFIPDKVKLFKYLNSEKVISDKENAKKLDSKIVDEKLDLKKTPVKELKKEPEVIATTSKITKEKNVRDIKADVINKTIPESEKKQDIEFEVSPIKKEPKIILQEINKELTKEKKDVKIVKKSKERHKKIVKDFFIDPSKEVEVIDETTDKEKWEKKKNATVKGKIKAETKEGTEKFSFSKKIRDLDKSRKKEQEEELRNKLKAAEEKKAIVEKEKVIKEKVEPKKFEQIKEKKAEPIKETKTKKEGRALFTRTKKVETERPVEKRKLLSLDNVVSSSGVKKAGGKKQSDVMNDIFSKIRAIKKEMNISPDENRETIDVKADVNKRKRNRTVEFEDKKIVEKESTVKQQSKSVETEKELVEEKKEQIKKIDKKVETIEEKVKEKEETTIGEKTLTAKDLFKRHQKNKYESKEGEPVERTKSKIESLFDNPKTEKKEIVESSVKLTVKKEAENKIETKSEVKIDKTIKVEKKEDSKLTEKKIENDESNTTGGSAADALLKRIAMKKQKIKAEEETEVIKEVISVKEKEKEIDVELHENKNVVLESKVIEKEKSSKPKKTKNLIDDFINKSDSLERMKVDKEIKLKGDVSVKSFEEKEEFMTEAMADLFIEQEYFDKAMNVYKKLILKFPQKKTYFAIQIKKLESLIKNNK